MKSGSTWNLRDIKFTIKYIFALFFAIVNFYADITKAILTFHFIIQKSRCQ